MAHGPARRPPTEDTEPAAGHAAAPPMDGVEARVLTRIQRDFPVVSRPFAALGEELGLTEDEVRSAVTRLSERRLIRSLGPVFDPRALGYVSTLCAASVPAEKVDTVAAIINARPEVTHNYLRAHPVNLWFTVIAQPEARLAQIIAELERDTGLVIHNLPAERLFKIRVEFDFTDGAPVSAAAPASALVSPAAPGSGVPAAGGASLSGFPTEEDRAAIRALQDGLPVEARPFAAVAARAGLSEGELLARTTLFLERGYLRRLGALVRHRATGVTANAMSVWRCPLEQAEAAGQTMTGFREVSHCYQRPAFEGWPYTLFAMIHAATEEGCQSAAARLSEATGLSDYELLFSTRELKKTSMRYFVS